MSQPKKLIYLVTEDWYFYSHRLPMVKAAQNAGFDVAVITNVDRHKDAIAEKGVRVIPLSLERRSLNPFKALRHIRQISKIYKQEKPDLVHHIAMKPVLYGAIAAWVTGVPHVINAFAGLGYVFSAATPLAFALRFFLLLVFRPLLKRPESFLLLQNNDDRDSLQSRGLAPAGRTHVIRGSGIDLDRYPEQSPPPDPAPDFICVYAGRMIDIKGLPTLQQAFALLAQRMPSVKLWLCGVPDTANPGSWNLARLQRWVAKSNNVVYRGYCEDMKQIWGQAHLAVQASYGGEGVPKSLLEAAACGRAIVATNVPGCREMVEDGRNGYLVPPHDAEKLAVAIEKMAGHLVQTREMGGFSRKMLENSDMSSKSIISLMETLYREILNSAHALKKGG